MALRRRLLLVVAAGILPVVLASGLALRALVDHQQARVKQSGIEVTRALSTAVDAELQRSIAVLEALAADRRLDGDLHRYHEILRGVLATRPEWLAVTVHAAGGTKLLNTRFDFDAPLPETTEPESLARVLEFSRPVVGDLAFAQGIPAVPVRVPVMREETLRYVLTAVVKPDVVLAVVTRQRLPEDWVVSVFDAKDLRVARSRQHLRFLGHGPSPTLLELMRSGAPEGTGMTHALEGDRVYTAYTRSQATGWTVAIGIPPSVVELAATGPFLTYGGGTLLSVVLGILAALVVGRGITAPMAKLRAAARALGQREMPVAPDTDIHEVHEVADALVMAAGERARAETEREALLTRERDARSAAEASERRAAALAALVADVNETLDVDTVLQRVVEGGRQLLAADVAWLALREGEACVSRYLSGVRSPRWRNTLVREGRGMGGVVMQLGRPLRTDDYERDPRFTSDYHDLVHEEGIVAQLVVPILDAERVVGLLYVANRRPQPFGEGDEAVSIGLAAHAAIAIRNSQLYQSERAARADAEHREREVARLYDDARRRQREAEALAAVAHTINTLDLDTALQNITHSACTLLQAHVATLFRLDPESGNLILVAGGGPRGTTRHRHTVVPRGTGLVGIAVERREVAVTDDMLGDPRIVYTPDMRERIQAEQQRVGLAVPLMVQTRITGVLFVGALAGRRFSPDEVRLASTFADQAAVAIANAELYQDMQRANRAKDEFLAMLGHELRNPLSAITGAAGLLSSAGGVQPSVERARAVIGRQVQHLSRLVDDLLDVSRVTSGKVVLLRQPIDLATLATNTVAGWRAAGRFARHRVSIEATSVWVEADETRMEQVLGNLLGNAVKYTPAGGAITVRVGADGDRALLEIHDTGVGIPAGLADRMFELFVQGERTLDRAQGGLGIGLTLARALVEMHGGTVEARSAGPGQGATFSILLPRIPASSGPAANVAPAPAPQTTRRVLIIEDNTDAREMLRMQLALDGHQVHEAADGPTGLDLAATVEPDIALVDVGLPGVDGYEVARRIRAQENGKAIVLVALTGYGQAEDRKRALEAGFDIHVTKPVLPERLAEIVAGAGRNGGPR